MEILNLLPKVYDHFLMFILVMARISSMLSMFILFRREYITSRVIAALSAILAVIVVLVVPNQPAKFEVLSFAMFLQILTQVIIGFIGGMILNIVFDMFMAVGQIISTQIGLSMASLIDPRFGNITNLTHYYLMVTALLFFLMNGHLFMIKTVMDSFSIFPVNEVFLPFKNFSTILEYSSVIFSGGILLSITIIIAMLLTNMSLAVMTKFAPQFNLFSIGINISLILGLICVYFTFHLFVDQSTTLIERSLELLQRTFMRMA